MPVYDLIPCQTGIITKITEVNPQRETLTITNWSPFTIFLADDDHPSTTQLHGIAMAGFSVVTLERKDGDRPDKAWYIFSELGIANILKFEGMITKEKRWW